MWSPVKNQELGPRRVWVKLSVSREDKTWAGPLHSRSRRSCYSWSVLHLMYKLTTTWGNNWIAYFSSPELWSVRSIEVFARGVYRCAMHVLAASRAEITYTLLLQTAINFFHAKIKRTLMVQKCKYLVGACSILLCTLMVFWSKKLIFRTKN